MNNVKDKSPTKLHPLAKDISGQRFGRLVVVGFAEHVTKKRNLHWRAVCDCGSSRIVNGASLRAGITKSCGCIQREKARAAGDRTRTHGLSGTSIYSIWDSMIQRCENPNRKDFKTYGLRGITVCERWHTFENFLSDMGARPYGLTLDRKDGSLGYSPENCRWATTKEQARNRPDNRILTLNGESLCLQDWAELLGINKITLQARVSRGWNDVRALTTPVEMRYSHAKNVGRTKQGEPNAVL